MIGTPLNAPYKDREKVKALGARWDPMLRQWVVPAGRDLGPFSPWLPPDEARAGTLLRAAEPAASYGALPARGDTTVAPWDGGGVSGPAGHMAVAAGGAVALGAAGLVAAGGPGSLAAAASLSLSQLLGGVAQTVAQAYRAGVWTRLEVLRADARRGHVYLEVAERDANGQTVAQARVTVWADTAQRIVPEFERATGVVLGAGIKLLVRARPQFHALYGLSLWVDAIDPAFTLGDLEAKKRDIRLRLQQEGLFDANRRLPPPWDFNHVLVVAPEGAAGLGDFRAEAQRLSHHGLCQFSYVHARFQGEGAPDDIRHALLAALHAHHAAAQAGTALPLDAVVLIRGGGAVNDLAWLNDLALARTLCELPLPVFTGIGHERDRTVLDEVAQLAFDTPSKVVAGIEQRIAQRAAQAREHFATLVQAAQRQLALARQGSAWALQSLQTHAHHSLAQAERQRQTAWLEVQRGAQRQLALARQAVPAQLAQVQAQARQQLRDARHLSASGWAQVLERSRSGLALAREALHHEHTDLGRLARLSLGQARQHSQALMREIAGQGPDKTLGRGFALVRQADTGQALTAAAQAAPGARLALQFHDGGLAVVVSPVRPDTP